MHTVSTMLQDSDPALLPVLAQVWGASIQTLKPGEALKALGQAMLQPQAAERVWTGLADHQRGALQTLLGSSGRMPTPMFERLFGKVRKMGAGRIEREKPHLNPENIAEALFYRGLIAVAFEQGKMGVESITYVPSDLIPILPVHKTAYENLAAAEDEPLPEDDTSASAGALAEIAQVQAVHPADTSIVDDLTTLLAYLRVNSTLADAGTPGSVVLREEDADALLPHLLVPDEIRLDFLLGLALSAELVGIQDNQLYVRREATAWLSAPRAQQVHKLVESWRDSVLYRDLWHVPGLYPEVDAGDMAAYHPTVARAVLLQFMGDLVPRQAWWSLEQFIEAIKETEPDFQRPGGNYDAWYIRNEDGEYLRGFESWDAVEGALIEFMILGPLHWLGLLDTAEDAARLTAYGRALVTGAAWPAPPDPDDSIMLKEDGTLLISRKISRVERFQAARFTSWLGAPDSREAPYGYRLDAEGIKRAAEQNITTAHIAAFLKRVLNDAPLPKNLARLLETWQAGATAAVSFERLLVLRTTAVETLDFIAETPALRRYLGARLGPMAVVIRADQWEALKAALEAQGIDVHLAMEAD